MQDFPKTARLTKPSEFTKVFRQGRFRRAKHQVRLIVLNLCQTRNGTGTRLVPDDVFVDRRPARPRLGVVVPKRGNKSAVRRNRIKRLVRESFRCRQSTLPNGDLVVQVMSAISDDDLRSALAELLLDLSKELA